MTQISKLIIPMSLLLGLNANAKIENYTCQITEKSPQVSAKTTRAQFTITDDNIFEVTTPELSTGALRAIPMSYLYYANEQFLLTLATNGGIGFKLESISRSGKREFLLSADHCEEQKRTAINAGADVFPAAPSDQVFSEVRKYAFNNKYVGRDILVCLDPQNGQVKLAGASHWSGIMDLFMDYKGGRTEVGQFRRTSDRQAKVQTYSDGGNLVLTLDSQGFEGSLALFYGSISNEKGHASIEMPCFLRKSALE